MKKFKAIMIDVDGTLIPYEMGAIPSKKVTEAINKASKKIHIGIATSRPLSFTTDIAKHLNLTGPSIISGGAQIVDFASNKIVWEKHIDTNVIGTVAQIFKEHEMKLFINDDGKDFEYSENYKPNKPFNMYSFGQPIEEADKILEALSKISTISAVKARSWTPNSWDVLVYHSMATKQHGILEVAKILKIDLKDMIAMGDGYNDFPLLMSAGFKVAMGNAVPELKEVADFVAPSVFEDGVADVIERFVL